MRHLKRKHQATTECYCGSFSPWGDSCFNPVLTKNHQSLVYFYRSSTSCSTVYLEVAQSFDQVQIEQELQNPGQRLDINPSCRTNTVSPIAASFAQVLKNTGFSCLFLRITRSLVLKRHLKYGGSSLLQHVQL